jgi:hypothetical protein
MLTAKDIKGQLHGYLRGGPNVREALRRRWFFEVAKRVTPILAVDSDIGRVLVSTEDQIIGKGAFIHGGYDTDKIETILKDLAELVPSWASRGLIFEVGANIGTTTLMLARYAPAIAFEPVH